MRTEAAAGPAAGIPVRSLVLALGVAAAFIASGALFASGGGLSPSAEAAAERLVAQGRASFQERPLLQAKAELGACADASPGDEACAYQAGRACLYLSFVLELEGRKDQARDQLGPGERWAGQAARLDPKSALPHVLLAELYGREVQLGGAFAALRYGSRNGREVAAAARLAPDDPQVLEVQGLRYLYAPAFVGGSPSRARAFLERALKSGDSDWIRYYLALALRRQGHADLARAQLLKAHALNPANALVNAALRGS